MNEEIGQRVIQNIFDMWLRPRINELKSSGSIGDDFKLVKAQLVFSPDQQNPVIRLNSKVKGTIVVVPRAGIFKKGEIVRADQISEIKGYIPIADDKNKNKAIITLILISDHWFLDYDMRYNKERCKETINAAQEFYRTAESARKRGDMRPTLENGFGAAELATKAILGTLPYKMINKKTHKATLKALEKWTELGNIDPKYAICLKELNKVRLAARYMTSND